MEGKKQKMDVGKENKPEQGKKIAVDRSTLKYVLGYLMLAILFAWTLGNLDRVFSLCGKIASLFSPFLLGGGIAFLMNVILRPLEKCWSKVFRKRGSGLVRPVCLTISSVVILGALFSLVFMMIPSLRSSGEEFVRSIPVYVEKIGDWWSEIVSFAARHDIVLQEYSFDPDLLVGRITNYLSAEGNGIITITWGAATSLMATLINVLLAFVFALYLLARKEAVAEHLNGLLVTVLPSHRAQRLLRIAKLSNQTFTSFVSGQMLEAVIIGVLCFVGMLILRIPHAGLVSTFIGMTALIPVFGAWLGGGLGAFLILMTEPAKTVWFVIFLLILQQLEGNLIYPKVVGKSVGLPGILVLMAVTIGGKAFGILGMLFGVPVCAVIYSLYLEFIKRNRSDCCPPA